MEFLEKLGYASVGEAFHFDKKAFLHERLDLLGRTAYDSRRLSLVDLGTLIERRPMADDWSKYEVAVSAMAIVGGYIFGEDIRNLMRSTIDYFAGVVDCGLVIDPSVLGKCSEDFFVLIRDLESITSFDISTHLFDAIGVSLDEAISAVRILMWMDIHWKIITLLIKNGGIPLVDAIYSRGLLDEDRIAGLLPSREAPARRWMKALREDCREGFFDSLLEWVGNPYERDDTTNISILALLVATRRGWISSRDRFVSRWLDFPWMEMTLLLHPWGDTMEAAIKTMQLPRKRKIMHARYVQTLDPLAFDETSENARSDSLGDSALGIVFPVERAGMFMHALTLFSDQRGRRIPMNCFDFLEIFEPDERIFLYHLIGDRLLEDVKYNFWNKHRRGWRFVMAPIVAVHEKEQLVNEFLFVITVLGIEEDIRHISSAELRRKCEELHGRCVAELRPAEKKAAMVLVSCQKWNELEEKPRCTPEGMARFCGILALLDHDTIKKIMDLLFGPLLEGALWREVERFSGLVAGNCMTSAVSQ